MKSFLPSFLAVGIFAVSASATLHATAISFANSINYSENFSSLNTTGNITWNDGATVQGWYLRAATAGYDGDTAPGDGIPNTVFGRNISDLGSTGAAYHIGPDATTRALSWVRSTATGLVYIGTQFQNTGSSGTFSLNPTFNMEQWRAVDGSSSTLTLQYRVTSTGGNILTTSGWTTVGSTASLPNTSVTGNVDGTLSANQFTLGGSVTNVAINANQFLNFRIVGNIPNGAGFGVGSANIVVIPEPATASLVGLLGLAAFVVIARRRRMGACATS